ncbi:MAG: hypothetical protein LBS24_02160 [Clostridiales Family XIII bacterium]|jgi:H+/gluconate symporter-like permease|nr:hypothetical protein [Clostridiales Family XIII bacterium]
MGFQLIGLIVAMLVMMALILRGLNPILSTIVGCSLMVWTNSLPYTQTFQDGLTLWGSVMMQPIFVVLLGAAMGMVFTKSGAIDSIAGLLLQPTKAVKNENAKLIVAILALLVFRVVLGLAGFINEAITVTMLAVTGVICRNADIPRRHLCALLAFASSCGTILPAAPTMLNVFLELNLPGYSSTAYLVPRILFMLVWIVLFCVLMVIVIGKDRKLDKHFEPGNMIIPELSDRRPPVWLCFIPIVVVIITYTFLSFAAWISIAFGLISSIIVLYKYIPAEEGRTRLGSVLKCAGDGTLLIPLQLMIMTLPTMILMNAPSFEWGTGAMAELDFPVVISLAVFIVIMMFFAGLGAVPTICMVFTASFASTGVSIYVVASLSAWAVAFSGGLPSNAAIAIEAKLSDYEVKDVYPTILVGNIVTSTVLLVLTVIASLAGVFG